MKRHRAELIIIPPIAVPNGVYKRTFHEAYRTRNLPDIRAQLSICESRAASPRELSRISAEYRENRGAIIPGRDAPRKRATAWCGTRARAHGAILPRCLSSAGAFHQSHANNSLPLAAECSGNLCACAGMPSFSFAIAVARVRSAASFGEQIARDQTTSITPSAERSLICVR